MNVQNFRYIKKSRNTIYKQKLPEHNLSAPYYKYTSRNGDVPVEITKESFRKIKEKRENSCNNFSIFYP